MVPRAIIIRGLATGIAWWKRRALASPNVRFVVVTGTVGKTTIRHLTSYGLHRVGQRVNSIDRGYTNELGVALSALGIVQGSLHHLATWRAIHRARAPLNTTYVVIELGADFRSDLAWFLARWSPWAVIIGGIDPNDWAGHPDAIRQQRQQLLQKTLSSGYILFDRADPVAQQLLTAAKPTATVLSWRIDGQPAEATIDDWQHQPSGDVVHGRVGNTHFSYSGMTAMYQPQVHAIAAAALLIAQIAPNQLSDAFHGYQFLPNRLRTFTSAAGVRIIADTYKVTPMCTAWLLETALQQVARRRILLLSGLHPLSVAGLTRLTKIGDICRGFDAVLFMGPVDQWQKLRIACSKIQRVQKSLTVVAGDLLRQTSVDDLIVIKGDARYHFDRIVDQLASNANHPGTGKHRGRA